MGKTGRDCARLRQKVVEGVPAPPRVAVSGARARGRVGPGLGDPPVAQSIFCGVRGGSKFFYNSFRERCCSGAERTYVGGPHVGSDMDEVAPRIDLDALDLDWGAVKLSPSQTGLPMSVWMTENAGHTHDVRVKVSPLHGVRGSLAWRGRRSVCGRRRMRLCRAACLRLMSCWSADRSSSTVTRLWSSGTARSTCPRSWRGCGRCSGLLPEPRLGSVLSSRAIEVCWINPDRGTDPLVFSTRQPIRAHPP
jgi:hypothetical protein